MPTGYRVRVTREGRMRESLATDVVRAIEVARILASGSIKGIYILRTVTLTECDLSPAESSMMREH
jgi:hypothetical protein